MEKKEEIKEITRKILTPLGFDGSIDVFEDGEDIRINAQTTDAGSLIGKGGENLRALQHLLLLVVSRSFNYSFGPGRFSLDVNNYKREREDHIASIARNIAYEVKETRHEQELEPMPASERRIVHVTLSAFDGVTTESIGERKERRVVVKPKI